LTNPPPPSAYNLRFPGQYYDQESGTYCNYFRDYDPGNGRYTTSDPIDLASGINTYAYVWGNPVNATDSSGLINDTLADIGFTAYDLYKLASDGACERNSNLTALGFDIVGAITPGVTGLGAASRVAKGAVEIPWSSKIVRDAAKALEQGATEVKLGSRSQAEALFFGRYQGQGYRKSL